MELTVAQIAKTTDYATLAKTIINGVVSLEFEKMSNKQLLKLAEMTFGQTLKVAKLRNACDGEGVIFKPNSPVDEELCAMLEHLHERVLRELLMRVIMA